MKKIISLLLISLIVQICWAQSGDGYDPANPADPQLYYSLTLESAPKRGGRVESYTNTKMLTVGTEVHCYANPKSGYKFKQWMEGENIISKESSFSYTMPDRNVTLIAYFDKDENGYNPENPDDPNIKGYSHKVSVYATPSAAGYFNSSYFELYEGDSTNIYAYPRNGYQFEAWQKNGKVYSVENPLSIVMGTTNQVYTAKFSYNPENPSDPGANVFNTATGELVVDRFKPGYLYSAISNAIGQNDYSAVQSILVSGIMDVEDLGFSSRFSNCTTIDISRTSGYKEIPSWSFEDCGALSAVILPSCIQKIGRNAFEGCNSLSVITCYALFPPALEANAFGGHTGLVIKVPSSALSLYQKAEGWKVFSILPLDEETSSIIVNLSTDASNGKYNNMYIELRNTNNGQVLKNLVSNEKTTFTFVGLLKDCTYDVAVKTPNGAILGERKDIVLGENDVTVSFNSLLQPQNVMLELYSPDGNKIDQSLYSVSWLNASGNYIGQGQNISGLIEGETIEYNATLTQELAEIYKAIEKGSYTVKSSNNVIDVTLSKYGKVSVNGVVKDLTTEQPVPGAIIAVSQTFGGKYSKAFTSTSDTDGKFSLEAFEGKGKMAISASNYITQNLDVKDFASELPEIGLKPVTGASVHISLSYTESVVKDSVANISEYYSDNDNVLYSIYNKTKNKSINDFKVQYPSIILLESVAEGDELYITAHSKNDVFADTETSCTIDSNNRAIAHFNITQYGAVKSVIASTNGKPYIGILYDDKGLFVSKGTYKDGTFSMDNIADGKYTLVSMLNSKFFSTVNSIDDINAAGLVEGQDYAASEVEVRSGLISELSYETVSAFDESKFYYTGNETSFIANKASTTIGNYVTLRGKVDFKSAYAGSVRGAYLVVDIPEACMFVENSVLTGKGLASYTLQGNKLNIPLEGTDNNVRFCVIPTQGGDFNPSASVQFELDNENFVQPIGAAYFHADNLSLNAPEKTPNKIVAVSGNAIADSEIKVYDNDVLVCQTRSMANGYWSVSLPLIKPYSHSFHKIYGEMTDSNGNTLLTDTKTVEYDESCVVLSKVSMIYNGTTIVFDEINGKTSNNTYSYAPSITDFTFVADFTSNDTTKIGDVVFKVLASDGTIRSIDAKYSESKNKWVAKATYANSAKLPVNVTVEYTYNHNNYFLDKERTKNEKERILNLCNNFAVQLQDNNLNQTIDRENMLRAEYITANNNIVGMDIISINCADLPFDKSDGIQLNINDETFYINELYSENTYCIYLWDQSNAVKISFDKDAVEHRIAPMRTIGVLGRVNADWLYNPYSLVTGFLGYGDYMNVTENYKYWVENYDKCVSEHMKLSNKTVQLITAKCSDGSYKLTNNAKEAYSVLLNLCKDKCTDMEVEYQKNLKAYHDGLVRDFLRTSLLNIATLGLGSKLKGSMLVGKELVPGIFEYNKFGIWLWGKCSALVGENARSVYDFISGQIADKIVGKANDKIDNMIKSDKEFDVSDGADCMTAWYFTANKEILKEFNELNNKIRNSYGKCPKKKDPEEKVDEKDRQFKVIFVCPSLKPSVDPSGYVYEGVPSNRLEGVTASIYYKETEEDMYGELHDKVVLWDASEYAQKNPLFTDKDGMYAWDVPQGLWQVKFEKEGYETAYSEWLPVPPPQLDVNIAMTQNSQPEVRNVHAYDDGVDIEFSKYMLPNTLTTGNILVAINGNAIDGTVEILNAENNVNGVSYASKICFVPTEKIKEKSIWLTISNKVKSYANVAMQETFHQEFQIEHKLQAIDVDSVINMTAESEREINIHILPANSVAGKTLNVTTNSHLVVSISDESVVIDKEGNANITVKGELPGTATLEYSVEGYDIVGKTYVNVIDDRLQMTDNPIASIASGSKVNKGATVALSCATEGAVIYYTLDGSCPCENSTARILYDGTPIEINEDTQIRAIAYSEGLYESEVVSFFYTISDVSGVNNVTTKKVKVYPTVTKDIVNVDIEDGSHYNIIVASVSGTFVTSLENVTGKQSIDLTGLPSGLFIVAAYNNMNKYIVKVIKIE